MAVEFGYLKKMLNLTVRQRLSVLTVEHNGVSITIDRRGQGGAQVPVPGGFQEGKTDVAELMPHSAQSTSSEKLRAVKAPMAGVIHLSPKPGEAHFVKMGETVTKGQQVAVIEAMKTFSAIKASCSGVIEKIVVEAGDEVRGGQDVLFIRPTVESSDT